MVTKGEHADRGRCRHRFIPHYLTIPTYVLVCSSKIAPIFLFVCYITRAKGMSQISADPCVKEAVYTTSIIGGAQIPSLTTPIKERFVTENRRQEGSPLSHTHPPTHPPDGLGDK